MELSNTGSYLFLAAAVVFGIGFLVSLAANVWLIVRAFCVGVGWGLAVLFLPIANLVFVFVHWPVARKPFLLGLTGLAAAMVAVGLGLAGGVGVAKNTIINGSGMKPAAGAEFREAAEAPGPLSDRDRIAGMLEDAGIDPANPATFKGRTIPQMIEALGKPSATMKAGPDVTYIFLNCFEIVSEDGGKTVSSAHYMGK